MKRTDRIYVAGAETLLGNALVRRLSGQGYSLVDGGPAYPPELTERTQVEAFFERTRPSHVFLAAGMSGGIAANQRMPAALMLDNLLSACHVIHSAQKYAARKLLYVASSCSYPRSCPQPMAEALLMTGPLEPTNEAYATAKITGIKLCQAYRQQYGADMISIIPANMFGPGDDFGSEDSHVIAALMSKMDRAKRGAVDSVEVWGTGTPRREFVYVDDVADAAIFLMENYSGPAPVNVGAGAALSIREIAELIRDVVGYRGQLRFDPGKPDGMPVKSLDSGALFSMGWRPTTTLRAGLETTYHWLLENNRRIA